MTTPRLLGICLWLPSASTIATLPQRDVDPTMHSRVTRNKQKPSPTPRLTALAGHPGSRPQQPPPLVEGVPTPAPTRPAIIYYIPHSTQTLCVPPLERATKRLL